jgi:tRNA pseudouridine38-40 synthase
MIRLIVGMSLQVGKGKVSLATVENALQKKVPLKEALSAPAKGLFLMDIEYPYI